eukprot:1555851-Amphidinium_carterae.1
MAARLALGQDTCAPLCIRTLWFVHVLEDASGKCNRSTCKDHPAQPARTAEIFRQSSPAYAKGNARSCSSSAGTRWTRVNV